MSRQTLKKTFFALPIILPSIALFGGLACTRAPEPDFARLAPQRWIVAGAVPEEFQRASEWNTKGTCPKDAILTPLMKYKATPSEARAFGTEHYFGRSCQVVTPYTPVTDTVANRAPASVSSDAATELEANYLPHGPFVFWFSDGKLMKEGTFVNGTPEGEWKEYSRNGKAHAIR